MFHEWINIKPKKHINPNGRYENIYHIMTYEIKIGITNQIKQLIALRDSILLSATEEKQPM
jgi:hypothetical protein